MKKTLLFSSLLITGFFSEAQETYTHQYFFTSGGQFLGPANTVAIGYVKNNKVEYIDAIKGDFSNAVNVFYNESQSRYEGIAHIGRASGGDLLVRHDLDTYEIIDSTYSSGVTALARNAEKIVVVKGYGAKGAKVDLLASDFDSLASFPEITNDCKSVKIFGDFAYISHSDSVGRISVIHLKTNTLTTTFDLGKKAVGIGNLVVSKGPGTSVALYFSGGSDSTYQFVNTFIYSKKGMDVLAVTNKHVFGIERTSPTLTLVKIDKTNMSPITAPGAWNSGSFNWDLSAQYDTVNDNYLVMRPNYSDLGALIRMDVKGLIDSLAVKPSATALAIDYRTRITTALFASNKSTVPFKAYPNPCRESMTVQTSTAGVSTAQICSADGRMIESHEVAGRGEFKISTSHLEKGIYTLCLNSENGRETFKFIKE